MIDLEAHGLVRPRSAPRDLGGPRNIAQLIARLVARGPDDIVLVGRAGRLTAAEVDRLSDRAAHALVSLGVEPGTRVGASLPNDLDIVIAFFGAMKAGAIWVGLNRPLAPPEKAYMLSDGGVEVVLGDAEMARQFLGVRPGLPSLRHVVACGDGAVEDACVSWRALLDAAPDDPFERDVDPSAPAAISYTSGTTGFPKGAVHTQHNLVLPGLVAARRARAVSSAGDGPAPAVVLGVPLPLTILNLMVLGPLSAFQAGARLVAMDRVDGRGMADWIALERVTTFSAVPAMVHSLLTDPEITDEMLESIDAIGVGGADLPDAFRRLYEQRFGRRVGTGYGLTEAPTSVTAEDVTLPAVPGSCGRALPQVRIHVVGEDDVELAPDEVGEVCVGPADDGEFADVYRPMLGYWNRAEDTRRALAGGLLHTGDIGCLDAAGNLFIKDRKNDLIIRGGANVYPAEVERILHDDPSVAACAVVGRPDERLGERVVAFVELVPGSVAHAESLLERCRANLARYKVPDSITFVDGFERTPMGKIRKSVLRV